MHWDHGSERAVVPVDAGVFSSRRAAEDVADGGAFHRLCATSTPSALYQYIQHGLSRGFSLYLASPPQSAVTPFSDFQVRPHLRGAVDAYLHREVQLGRLELVDGGSATTRIAAIPKSSGNIRLITDCSVATGPGGRQLGPNGSVEGVPHTKLPTVMNFARDIRSRALAEWRGANIRLAKTDISEAFRHLPLDAVSSAAVRFRWGSRVYQDRRLPMGAKASVAIMQRVVEVIMATVSRRFPVLGVAYIDDLALAGPAPAVAAALEFLLQVLREVHLPPAMEKTYWPSDQLEFLGHDIKMAPTGDEVGTIAVTLDRRRKLRRQIRALLPRFTRDRVRPGRLAHQLRKLLGRLVFLTPVVLPGPGFLRAAFAFLARLLGHPTAMFNRQDRPSWYRPMARHAAADLVWWAKVLDLRHPSPCRPFPREWSARDDLLVCSDASTFAAGVLVYRKGWPIAAYYAQYPTVASSDIYRAEAAIMAVGIAQILATWPDHKHVRWCTDNLGSVYAWQKRRTRDPALNSLMRDTFVRMARAGLELDPAWVPGVDNIDADALSRQTTFAAARNLWNALQVRPFQLGRPLPAGVDAAPSSGGTAGEHFIPLIPVAIPTTMWRSTRGSAPLEEGNKTISRRLANGGPPLRQRAAGRPQISRPCPPNNFRMNLSVLQHSSRSRTVSRGARSAPTCTTFAGSQH